MNETTAENLCDTCGKTMQFDGGHHPPPGFQFEGPCTKCTLHPFVSSSATEDDLDKKSSGISAIKAGSNEPSTNGSATVPPLEVAREALFALIADGFTGEELVEAVDDFERAARAARDEEWSRVQAVKDSANADNLHDWIGAFESARNAFLTAPDPECAAIPILIESESQSDE